MNMKARSLSNVAHLLAGWCGKPDTANRGFGHLLLRDSLQCGDNPFIAATKWVEVKKWNNRVILMSAVGFSLFAVIFVASLLESPMGIWIFSVIGVVLCTAPTYFLSRNVELTLARYRGEILRAQAWLTILEQNVGYGVDDLMIHDLEFLQEQVHKRLIRGARIVLRAEVEVSENATIIPQNDKDWEAREAVVASRNRLKTDLVSSHAMFFPSEIVSRPLGYFIDQAKKELRQERELKEKVGKKLKQNSGDVVVSTESYDVMVGCE